MTSERLGWLLAALLLVAVCFFRMHVGEDFLYAIGPAQNEALNDSYGDLALSVQKSGKWELPSRLTPVVPVFFLVLHKIWGGFQGIPFTYGLLFTLTILCVFAALSRSLGGLAGFAGALAAALTARTEFFRAPMSEGLSFVLTGLTLCVMVETYRRREIRRLYLTAVLASVTLFCRPALQFLLAIVALFGVGVLWGLRPVSRPVKPAVIFFALLLAPSLSWMAFNKARGGEFSTSNIGSLSAAGGLLPFYPGGIPPVIEGDLLSQQVAQGLAIVNRQLDEGLLSAADDEQVQKSFGIASFPAHCRTYRTVLQCKQDDPRWVADYLDRANGPFSNAIADSAWVVLGKPAPIRGEHTVAVLTLADHLGKAILADIGKHRPGAIAYAVGLGFQTHLQMGPPWEWRRLWGYETGLCFLAYLAMLWVFLRDLFRQQAPDRLAFICVLFGTVHLAHIALCSAFGHPLPRYTFLLFPYFAVGPAIVAAVQIPQFWRSGRLQALVKRTMFSR